MLIDNKTHERLIVYLLVIYLTVINYKWDVLNIITFVQLIRPLYTRHMYTI